MHWGTELWDQFDNIEKHTQWGIDFLERYTKFVKERLDIEQSYAKQLRNLVKKYGPKRSSKDEEPRFTYCQSFFQVLNELNDYAGQREVVAEEIGHRVYGELMRYSHELKMERKAHLQEGRKAQQYLDTCWKQMDNSKKKFERECKETEKAQLCYEKLDSDHNATKADVEKAKQQLNLRTHMADECKNEYAAQLQNFNSEQQKHFQFIMPQIFKNLQDMDERRIVKLSECYRGFAEAERRVVPIINKCLEGMISAAKSVDDRKDSLIVVESFKSGFEPPGDFPFEDFSQNIYRTVSDGSLSAQRQEMRGDQKYTIGKSKGKLWPFGKKSKLLFPPLSPTTSCSSFDPYGLQTPRFSRDPLSYCMNELKTVKPRIPSFKNFKRGLSIKLGTVSEDFSHLPPEQRRKKLQQRIDELNKELQKEMDQRDALNKMKDVYERNPQMGDSGSLHPKISETMCNIDKLRHEIQKHEMWLFEVENRTCPRGDRRLSGGTAFERPAEINHHGTPGRESPEGSYTDDPNQELRGNQRYPDPQRAPEFDDEFEDDEPLPAVGHCKALYPFDGQNEGTLAMREGEVLYVIEEDKGDGWTRTRKQNGQEGYVPTSYVDITLEKNSKGS
ncbi:formin-binding protein 1-like isoform X2 [Chiloscyllium plagiosum]|uniref:formin-binding protein 1-like isoform X2 n=1 Tax=Chiloscyllium plagiosum TaxID=36176 RepID=UPI001CB85B33|nr:formin-binding protein 1-like isoform X2 [Chiloscyllium plagiosum]